MSDRSKQGSANRYEVHAHAEAGTSADARKDSPAVNVVGTLNAIARKQGSHGASLRYFGGCLVLGGLIALLFFAPALCPLAFLGFVVTCLPHRVHSFTKRKWVFFLVDYCYFANLAAAAFLVWAPAHAGWEAAAYASVEGPLAGALVAWQCAWVMGSPDHIITVLMHSLPGLALFCHRRLAHTRQPLQLAAELAAALWGPEAAAPPVPGQAAAVATSAAAAAAAWGRGGGSTVEAAPAGFGATAWEAAGSRAIAAGAGLLRRLVAAADVARGRVPCGAAATAAAATDGAAGPAAGVMACYAVPLPPTACPAPAWLWLAVAPMLFYLAWQLLYFVVVQVCSRRFILARGYETSYRSLARRAQRSGSALNRLVRSGGVARRLFMFGLLQLLFTLVTLVLAVATYHSVEAAVAWQVVKLLLPLYLGAVHTCERAPVQELRAAAAQMAAAGLLAAPAAEALRAEVAGKHKVEGKPRGKVE